MNAIINAVTDPSFQIAALVTLAAVATAFTVLGPLLEGDKLKTRMKTVTSHRDSLRQAQREMLAKPVSALIERCLRLQMNPL